MKIWSSVFSALLDFKVIFPEPDFPEKEKSAILPSTSILTVSAKAVSSLQTLVNSLELILIVVGYSVSGIPRDSASKDNRFSKYSTDLPLPNHLINISILNLQNKFLSGFLDHGIYF